MKSCRIFNPRNWNIAKRSNAIFCNTSHAHGTKSWIRFVHEHSGSTICKYNSGSRQHYVLENIQHRVPSLANVAKACVYRVLNSADATWSNSIYNIAFYERRSLLPKTLKQLIFIHYNQCVTCGGSWISSGHYSVALSNCKTFIFQNINWISQH